MVTETDRWRTAALWLFPLAVLVSWTDLILVVRGWVLPHWVVGGALLLAAATVRVFRRRPAPARTGWQWAALALPALVAAVGAAIGGLGALWVEYRVLDPARPDGCRARFVTPDKKGS